MSPDNVMLAGQGGVNLLGGGSACGGGGSDDMNMTPYGHPDFVALGLKTGISTQVLVLDSSWDYDTGLGQGFVPKTPP